MRILHYINDIATAGAERVVSDTVSVFKASGHDVSIIISNDNKNSNRLHEKLSQNKIPLFQLGAGIYNPFQIFKLRAKIKELQPEVIHAHLFPTQYWLIFSFINKKDRILVKTEHNNQNNRRKYKFLKLVDRWIYKRYDVIICITEEVKKSLEAWIGEDFPLKVVNNGVDFTAVKNARLNINDKEFGEILKSGVSILMVGRFNGNAKDQKTLIKSLQYLPKHYHLYFAGDGEHKEDCVKFADSLGLGDRVFFLGLRSDVYTLMHIVDINVLSSRYEGLSGVTLESLASSTPFIGSDVPGIQDVVPDNRHLFPQGNAAAIAEKIRDIIENDFLKQDMVKKGNEHVKKYDIHVTATNYLDVYKEVLNEKRGITI